MQKLKKLKDITVDKFLSQIGKFLGQEAEIRASGPEGSIVYKDIDKVTTKEEVRGALEKEFGLIELQESAIKKLRTAHGGTQTTIINLPV